MLQKLALKVIDQVCIYKCVDAWIYKCGKCKNEVASEKDEYKFCPHCGRKITAYDGGYEHVLRDN